MRLALTADRLIAEVTKMTNQLLLRPLAVIAVAFILLGYFSVSIKPFTAFGGAVWFKDGAHYISGQQIADRIKEINSPYEATMAGSISQSTPSCDKVDEGFCEQSTDVYADKELVTPAVVYTPGTPDTKKITGYCTLCNDDTFSPSCAVGRGACSWHGGVAAYNVAEYITIPGKPAVPAQPAVYSYSTESYQDSPSYNLPATPSLSIIVNFAN